MSKFTLSPQAERSLSQINRYTLENHGEQQRRKYIRMLRDKMRTAAANPESGRKRTDIKQGYFSVQAERHHIYYRIKGEDQIEVIDVLHQSMEPRLHL